MGIFKHNQEAERLTREIDQATGADELYAAGVEEQILATEQIKQRVAKENGYTGDEAKIGVDLTGAESKRLGEEYLRQDLEDLEEEEGRIISSADVGRAAMKAMGKVEESADHRGEMVGDVRITEVNTGVRKRETEGRLGRAALLVSLKQKHEQLATDTVNLVKERIAEVDDSPAQMVQVANELNAQFLNDNYNRIIGERN